MDLPSKAVWDVLAESGVERIYHANSVITSCQFLRRKSLLSRGTVERLKLAQTIQYSDGIDKRHSIWFDVFADSVDIHARAKRLNKYGPVLFVMNLEGMRKTYTGRVWVTRLNPTKWQGVPQKDRWFQSKSDLEENYSHGTFDHMIVFRHCGGALPIENCLEEIIVDDPRMKVDGIDLYSAAVGALSLAMCDANLNITMTMRECAPRCSCRASYEHDEPATTQMFYPYA
jgi:hypothetical protein